MSTFKPESLVIQTDKHFNDEELIDYARSFSSCSGEIKEQLLHWDFGPVMHMRYQKDAANYLFSAEKVPFHWDGAFFREPLWLLFYCTETTGTGGETLFCNTEAFWNSLSAEEQEECQSVKLRYRTEKKAHYGGEITVNLVQRHPHTGATILRLAERVETDLNPVSLEILGIEKPEEFYRRMVEKLVDPRFTYAHEWRRGDLILCDNFTYLHGRKALGDNLSRSFKRIQIL